MADLKYLSTAQKAVLLLKKGLSPRASALRGDVEYQQLLALWRADPEFRRLVHELAPMLDLRVVDALDHAIILSPLGPDSVFAATLTDVRRGIGEMPRGGPRAHPHRDRGDLLPERRGPDRRPGRERRRIRVADARRGSASRALSTSGGAGERRPAAGRGGARGSVAGARPHA